LTGFSLRKFLSSGIARAASVSKKWLQDYVNNKYAQTLQQVKVSDKPKAKLEIECDEAWSFVANKDNKQWIWLALDKKTREIVGVYIGDLALARYLPAADRSESGANGLWNSLPPVYPRAFGRKLPPETLDANVQFVIQTFGHLMRKFYQNPGIKL